MTPELTIAIDMLGTASALIRASAEQSAFREPIPLPLEEIPEASTCERMNGRDYGLPCVYVHPTCGPVLVYAVKWPGRNALEGAWSVEAGHAYPNSGARHMINTYPEAPPLYPISDWPQLVRAWLAKRGTP